MENQKGARAQPRGYSVMCCLAKVPKCSTVLSIQQMHCDWKRLAYGKSWDPDTEHRDLKRQNLLPLCPSHTHVHVAPQLHRSCSSKSWTGLSFSCTKSHLSFFPFHRGDSEHSVLFLFFLFFPCQGLPSWDKHTAFMTPQKCCFTSCLALLGGCGPISGRGLGWGHWHLPQRSHLKRGND